MENKDKVQLDKIKELRKEIGDLISEREKLEDQYVCQKDIEEDAKNNYLDADKKYADIFRKIYNFKNDKMKGIHIFNYILLSVVILLCMYLISSIFPVIGIFVKVLPTFMAIFCSGVLGYSIGADFNNGVDKYFETIIENHLKKKYPEFEEMMKELDEIDKFMDKQDDIAKVAKDNQDKVMEKIRPYDRKITLNKFTLYELEKPYFDNLFNEEVIVQDSEDIRDDSQEDRGHSRVRRKENE